MDRRNLKTEAEAGIVACCHMRPSSGSDLRPALCIASRCMAWRWAGTVVEFAAPSLPELVPAARPGSFRPATADEIAARASIRADRTDLGYCGIAGDP